MSSRIDGAASRRGDGLVLGRPGIYHYATTHDYRPSTAYGYGQQVDTLCRRTSGIVYDETGLRQMWPNDRLCWFCEKAAKPLERA